MPLISLKIKAFKKQAKKPSTELLFFPRSIEIVTFLTQ